jgi:hypothetical protein
MWSGPTRLRMALATVVFPEPEPPAMPMTSGGKPGGIFEIESVAGARAVLRVKLGAGW